MSDQALQSIVFRLGFVFVLRYAQLLPKIPIFNPGTATSKRDVLLLTESCNLFLYDLPLLRRGEVITLRTHGNGKGIRDRPLAWGDGVKCKL